MYLTGGEGPTGATTLLIADRVDKTLPVVDGGKLSRDGVDRGVVRVWLHGVEMLRNMRELSSEETTGLKIGQTSETLVMAGGPGGIGV